VESRILVEREEMMRDVSPLALPTQSPEGHLGSHETLQTIAELRTQNVERMLALSRQGRSAQEVASEMGVSERTVLRWRRYANRKGMK
jgi:DNA-binding NarL/FixJ family response regulator